MSVLYQIVEQGRHITFVSENGDGLAELHSLLARASAIVEDENSGFAEALSTAAAERGTPLRRAFADEAEALSHDLGHGGAAEQRVVIDLDDGRIRVEYDQRADSLQESLDALASHFPTTGANRIQNRLAALLAEHDGGEELYEVLHDELGLTNQEIEAMTKQLPITPGLKMPWGFLCNGGITMKKATVTISFDQEKLKAIQFYAGKAGTSLESDLDEFMEKLYKRYVPSQTREYIESMAGPEEQPRLRSARSPRSATPDTLDAGKEAG